MALASGTANPMAQQALIEASQKKKTTTTPTPETKKSPIMTDAAMRARGLTTATQQTGNFAKALDAEVKANQAIVDAGGVIQNPSDSMSLSRQAQYGTAMGMTLGRTDSEGKAYDMGKTIDQQVVQSEQNWNDIKQQAFESGEVAPSRSQNLYATKNAQPQATTGGKGVETQSMREGKTKVITLPNGQTKEVPVNLKYEEYLQEKHPGLFETEEKMRRLNTIKQKVLAGGQLDQETMQYLQSIGVEPDANHITNAVNTILQNTEDYKMKQNVSGGYLMWQGERGNDVQEAEKKSFGEVAPEATTTTGQPVDSAVQPVDPNTITSGDVKTKTVGEMKDSGLSSYQSMMDDFKGLITAQIKQMNDSNKAMMDNLQKREDMYQAEKERALGRIEENASHLQSIASFQKDNQLQQNELEAGKTDRQYGSRLEQMQSRQARYQGYLAAKFQSAGMADSGAGLELLGQYLMAGEMAISEVSEAREDAKMAYLGRAQEIMSDYAEQAYKIESQRIDSGDKVSFDMNEAIMKIQDAKIQSVAKKDENILMAIKELGQKELDLRKQSFAEVMALADQKMKEMEFSQRVIQDAVRNSQWDQSFALEGVREQRAQDAQLTSSTGNLWMNNQDTGVRALPGLTYDQNVKEFERGIVERDRAFARGAFESDRAFSRGVYESDRSYSEAQRQSAYNMTKGMVESGVLPPTALTSYLDPSTAIMGMEYVDKNGTYKNLGERLEKIVGTVKNGVASALPKSILDNCVYFARKFIPDLPTGLTSYADKVNTLLKNNPNAIDYPEPSAVVVMKTNERWGHVAVVTGVDKEKGTITLSETNWKAGQYGTRTISMTDPAITGYWKSPNVKGTQQQQDTSVWANVPKDYRSMVAQQVSKFSTEPQVKTFSNLQVAKDTVDRIPNDTKNPSDDQALIYAFAKAMDPDSVVREGEYATAQKYSQSQLAGGAKSMEQFIAGKGFLTEEARKNIKKAITTKYDSQKASYMNIKESYKNSINDQAGVDVADALLKDYDYLENSTSQYASQLQQGEILVQDKNGNIGAIPANEYDPALYTKVQ